MKKTLAILLALTLALSCTFVLTSCDLFDDDDDYVVTQQGSSQDQNVISEDEALDIALAKVKGATKDDLMNIHLDVDDGRQVYDVSIFYDKMEHEFEIDAVTGDILEYDADRD